MTLALLAPCGWALDRAITSGLRTSRNYLFAEWNDIYAGAVDADRVVQGSSRAWVHVSPRVLDSVLGGRSYNLGMDGHGFLSQLGRYRIYRRHNRKPEWILQEVGANTLERRLGTFRPQQFLPYWEDPEIRRIAGVGGAFGPLDDWLPLYRYRQRGPSINLNGLLLRFGLTWLDAPTRKERGYEGQDKAWDDSFDRFRREHADGFTSVPDPEVVAAFAEFLAECRREGIRVALFWPPEYQEVHSLLRNRRELTERFAELAREHSAVFLDYSAGPLSRDRSFFYNSQHLNREGAERFSLELARDIRGFSEEPARARPDEDPIENPSDDVIG